MNFDEVLKKADTKDILDFRFPKYDMPIYPLVRWGILSYLNSGIDYLERKKNQRTRDIFSFSKYLLDTVIGNPFFSSQNDSIFFSSVVLDTTKKDGKYFNRIDDYFALIYQKKSLIVEDSFDRRYNKPRYYRKVRSNDYLRIKARIVSKLKTRKEKIEYESLDKLLEYCEKFILDVDKVAKQIKLQYIYYYFNGLFLEREYKKLFHKIKPKIIFVSDGHYGGFASCIPANT